MNQNSHLNQQPVLKNEDVNWEMCRQSLYQRKWLILTVTGIVLCLSAIVTTLLPDMYTAQASILVERVDDAALHYKEVLFPMAEQGPGYYETKVALLKSRPILEQTIEQLGLVKHYQKKDPRVKSIEDAVKILRKGIHASVLGRTQILKVDVKDVSAEMSANIANRISENFIREAWRERFFISDQLLKWFPGEAEALQKNSPIKRLQALEMDQVVSSLPSVMQDPVLNGIKQDRMKVDAEIQELSRRYTTAHPKMKELLARADYFESEWKGRIEKIVSGLKAGLAGQFSVNSIKIVENATVPSRPSDPKRFLIVLACTLLALLLSAWLAVFLEYLDRNIRTEENVRELSLSFLGYLPRIAGLEANSDGKNRQNVMELVNSDAKLHNDILNIRTSFVFSMPAERGKLIMFTSAVPGEGKSTLVAMLGVSLAESGSRVLLVDADMRHCTLHKIFNLENQKGLSACLTGALNVKDTIQIVGGNSSLHVLPAGKKPPNPVLLLGSSAMEELIHELACEYDRILFDVPPALHIADALILAKKMHGAVLIFDADKIHQTVGKKLIEKINMAGGNLIGAMINRAEYQRHDYYAYHQYQKYYNNAAANTNE